MEDFIGYEDNVLLLEELDAQIEAFAKEVCTALPEDLFELEQVLYKVLKLREYIDCADEAVDIEDYILDIESLMTSYYADQHDKWVTAIKSYLRKNMYNRLY